MEAHGEAKPAAPRTARERARAELTAEIVEAARARLAEGGAIGLSLRAVARDLGMASSAVYRYFPSRDALITRLIVDGYNSLADYCESAMNTAGTQGPQQWDALAHAVRGWAKANPHEFALLYGTPVPGYAAPPDTVDPATRIVVRFVQMLAASRPRSAGSAERTVTPELAAQFDLVGETVGVAPDDEAFIVGTSVWTALFGFVGFELFGSWNNTFEPADHLFSAHVELASRLLFEV